MVNYNFNDVGGISPQKIRMYLSSRGWEKTRSESRFDVFSNSKYEEQMVVPNNKDFTDYSKRITELISDLSKW